MDAESIAESAARLAADQRFEEHAVETLGRWLSQAQELPPGLTPSDVQHSFKRCALVFKNANFSCPYFETTLILLRRAQEIGTYRLITDANGNMEDDYLEWTHDF
jgi:hypothetical protein